MAATHVIVRSIPGESYLPGDEVDATLWRNAEKLVGMRYLRSLTKDELRAKANAAPAQEPSVPSVPAPAADAERSAFFAKKGPKKGR